MFSKHELASKIVADSGDFKVLEVHTKKAHYFNIPWTSLGNYGKRKFENLIVLSNAKVKLKIRYI